MQRGIGTSNGIGIGKALILERANIDVKVTQITDIQAELDRFNAAKSRFVEVTDLLIQNLSDKLEGDNNTSAIMKNQIYLVQDIELTKGIENLITSEHLCVEAAVDETLSMYVKMFSSMNDETMNQRAIDIEDVRVRLLKILLNIEELDIAHLPDNTVIIAHELPPSITAIMDINHIAGIVSENGGDTSHASILARALEIPAVFSVKDACSLIKNGDEIIVDGLYGEVFINPIPKTIDIYRRKQEEYRESIVELSKFKNKETLTQNGRKVSLVANIGTPKDIAKVLDVGGEGVGLFRTEFLFMNGFSMPTEEEQFEAYKRAAVMSSGKPLVIRTLDIGGDKDVPYMGLAKERNPFLGYRAIRYCLDRVDIFTKQLRAILRASAYGQIKIMIPLVTSLSEIVNVKRHLHNIMLELDRNEIKYDANIQLGVMIETPAACILADILAKEVDFFSIGTNDLIQYTIAVDRGNENVSYLYTPFHPAVIRSIKRIIECAKKENIPVGMCGEAAGNPKMIPLLLAFGLDEFSVTASNILETRKNIANWSDEEAKKVADAVMAMGTEKDIMNYLNDSTIANK